MINVTLHGNGKDELSRVKKYMRHSLELNFGDKIYLSSWPEI